MWSNGTRLSRKAVIAIIRRRNARGITDCKIAADLGIAQSVVTALRHRLGLPPVPHARRTARQSQLRFEAEESRCAGWPPVTRAQRRVLEALYRLSDPTRIAAVTAAAGLKDTESVRTIIHRLCAAGLVVRTADWRGRRCAYLFALAPRVAEDYEQHTNRQTYPPPPNPCPHPPGTPGKVDCLADRRRHHYGLWHPRDYTPALADRYELFLTGMTLQGDETSHRIA